MAIERNAMDEVLQWKVRWFAPTDSRCNEKSSFRLLSGSKYLEVIDVDPEMLVAQTPRLIGDGKKLSAVAIKDAKAALQTAVTAEANGEVCCNACNTDKADEELVACGCCHRCYHVHCAPGYGGHKTAEWWCNDCADASEGQ